MTKEKLKQLTYDEQYELANNSEDPKLLKLLYQVGNNEIKECISLNDNTPYEVIEKYFEKMNKD